MNSNDIDKYKTPFFFTAGALLGLAIGLKLKRVVIIK